MGTGIAKSHDELGDYNSEVEEADGEDPFEQAGEAQPTDLPKEKRNTTIFLDGDEYSEGSDVCNTDEDENAL